MNKIELLAPAGDLDRLKIAVMYGADAVFIGGKKFSLRSRASNFDLPAIREGVEFAHQYGAHVHVTVNMIPHDDDFNEFDQYLLALDECEVDAIIVASPYYLTRAKALGCNFEVHLSTQQSITNSQAIKFYEQLGADRVVLAREHTMDELKQIKMNTNVPIEVFTHGGMCVNYSGRCTLSNYMTNRDANRGGCAQSCRWKYEILDEKQGVITDNFSMSSKDMNAIDQLKDFMDLGITSLKIEGRMKTEYYIATIVRAYRQAIDELALNKPVEEVLTKARAELLNAENRATSNGFYGGIPSANGHLYGINGRDVNQAFVGKVVGYDKAEKRAYLEIRNQFNKNDLLEFFGPRRESVRFYPLDMINSEQEETERFYKPMEIVSIKSEYEMVPGDFIRKVLTNDH